MNANAQRAAARAIQRELTASIYHKENLRARHLIHLLSVAGPYTYSQLLHVLLSAPRVDGFVKLLNRIALYLDSSETFTGGDMDATEEAAKILSLSPPWVQVDLWHAMQHFHVAVLIKRLVLRDVMLYRAMPGCAGDLAQLRFIQHEPIYNDIVKRYLLKPDLLIIFFWAPQEPNTFHRIFFRSQDGKLLYEARHEVDQSHVEEALGLRLSESPFQE